MNTPGPTTGNWAWRLRPGELTPERAERLRRLAEETGRGLAHETQARVEPARRQRRDRTRGVADDQSLRAGDASRR